MPGLYIDFNIPLEVRKLVEKMVNQRRDKSTPNQNLILDELKRRWVSQPRSVQDKHKEVIRIKFKLPLSVSTISAEVLRRPCRVEIFYIDRSNNRRPVLNQNRTPLSVIVDGGIEANSWYKWFSRCYPIVAKEIQFVVSRVYQGQDDTKYSVGLKNILIKRNVFNRNDALRPLEDESDVYGNVITKYVKDWDSSKAIDDNAMTFWKSSPQPSPDAVVNFYLDLRDENGNAQTIDKVYLDPVYKGNLLNLYHSSDETTVLTKISQSTIAPSAEENFYWDTSKALNATLGESKYVLPVSWGNFTSEPMWFGFQWTPLFSSKNPPSRDISLIETNSNDKDAVNFSIKYLIATKEFEVKWQGFAISYTKKYLIEEDFDKNSPLNIVFGVNYTKNGGADLTFKAISYDSRSPKRIVSFTERGLKGVAEKFNFTNEIIIKNLSGSLSAMVIKKEVFGQQTSDLFMKNPTFYVSPDPVLPEDNGAVEHTSLDNALFAANWSEQSYAIGGRSSSEYEAKKWVPIWKDYFAEKGFIYLPEPITIKYMKFELTGLTPEPYPVYEPGIEVKYQVFPVSVEQESLQGFRLNIGKGVGGLLNFVNINGINHFNIFSRKSWSDAAQKLFGKTYSPVKLDVQKDNTVGTYPASQQDPISNSTRLELASNILNRREELAPYVLARNESYVTIKSDGLLKIEPYTKIPWQEIADANPGALDFNQKPGMLPVRGADYWVFPGQILKVPAHVMRGITNSSTVTELRAASTNRVRFQSNSVHKYETRTVKRDAAIAYFAGFREVTPYMSSYTANEDRDVIDFPVYNSPPWVLTNMETLGNGVTRATQPGGMAVFKMKTNSTFRRVKFDIRDSGYQRSDSMWNDDYDDRLSYNVTVTQPDGAAWTDFLTKWTDEKSDWGSPEGLVSINLDGDRVFDGKRVLRITRAAGTGEAKIAIRQANHFLADGCTVRLRAKVMKLTPSKNKMIMKFFEKGGAKPIYETTLPDQPGQWIDFASETFTTPNSGPGEYRVEFITKGDDKETILVSDIYSEVSHLHYYVVPGKTEGYEATDFRDITSLRENPDNGYFVAQEPINEMTVIVLAKSNKQYLYGMTINPLYLQ